MSIMSSPANHELRSLANGVFQNPGVCLQAVPSLPSPTPLFQFLALAPFFAMAKHRKSRSSVFLCSKTPQNRLLRRLRGLRSRWPGLRALRGLLGSWNFLNMSLYMLWMKLNSCFSFLSCGEMSTPCSELVYFVKVDIYLVHDQIKTFFKYKLFTVFLIFRHHD